MTGKKYDGFVMTTEVQDKLLSLQNMKDIKDVLNGAIAVMDGGETDTSGMSDEARDALDSLCSGLIEDAGARLGGKGRTAMNTERQQGCGEQIFRMSERYVNGLLMLDNRSLGEIMQAAFGYFLHGEVPEDLSMSNTQWALLELIQRDVDEHRDSALNNEVSGGKEQP